ncbi:Protein of unknown function [Pseudomonas benzenivorans]|nr:DUF3999 domain-containing protein [Pseudomonas benzenivorans]SDG61934.1 Protein of unknown function [Pseudomonas benzenivorans]
MNMGKKLRQAWLLASGLLLCSWGQAAERLDDYAVQLPLTLSGEGPWYRLELPMALHFAARFGDLRDLRVFNGAGEALAYALVRSEAGENLQEQAVKWFPLYAERDDELAAPRLRVQRSSTGTLIELVEPGALADAPAVLRGWLLDASAIEAPLVRLSLDWTAGQEGFQRFSIEASDDLQGWQPWGSGQLARLAFGGERIEQRQVELPGRPARYLRLLWQSPQQAPQLSAAQLLGRRSDSLPAPLVWSELMPATRNQSGEYQWQLPLALPLERLHVELEQANSLAPVRVSGRHDGGGRWQPLASGLLYRLPENGVEMRQDQLQLPGVAVQQLRLQVDERGGGLGSAAPRLRVGVRATQLVFLLRGGPPYRLALGRSAAQSAALPLGTLIPGFLPARLQRLGRARVELETDLNALAQPPGHVTRDWKRWGLWAVLLLGVGVLALMAASLLRRSPAQGSGAGRDE